MARAAFVLSRLWILALVVCPACTVLPPVTEHYRGLKAGLSSDVTAMGSFDDSAELSVYYVTNRVRSSSANQQPY